LWTWACIYQHGITLEPRGKAVLESEIGGDVSLRDKEEEKRNNDLMIVKRGILSEHDNRYFPDDDVHLQQPLFVRLVLIR
jgi:hypothetical protein